jgi:thymidylate synthase
MKPHNNIDTPYLMLLNRIRNEGNVKSDRTNTGTVSLFGNMIKLDVRDGYIPLLTTKKIFYESFIKETIWFISGSTDVKFLKDNGVGIWDEWVIPETSQWRPYTREEYTKAHQKLFCTDGDYNNQVFVAPFKDAYNWLRCHEQELYKQYRKAHPLDANIDNLRAFVQGKVEIPNMKLVSGSIGNGAYGSLWRNWEDTRITTVADYENTHKARGYKLVVKIDDSKCVITRNIDQLSVVVQQLKTNPDSRRIILSAWNPGRLEEAALPPCFPSGTLVSTPNGYKNIETIKEGDVVYSASMKPRRVNKVWITPYSDDMVGLVTTYSPTPLISTPNHPHYVEEKGWVDAKDIEIGDILRIPFNTPKTRSNKTFSYVKIREGVNTNVTKHITLTNEDYFMLGYFLGNGWYMKNSSNRVCFAIPHKKKDYILPRIRQSLKVSEKRGGGENVSTYETRSLKWAGIVEQFGHTAGNKNIPEWVFESELEAIDKFIEGYLEADGYTDDRGTMIFTTISKKLAFGLQRLFAMVGKPMGITYQKRKETTVIEGRFVKQQDTYSLRTSKQRHMTSTKITDSYMNVEVRDKLDLLPTKQINVYNLDVEKEHTYIANNIATHNCHNYSQYFSRPKTVPELMDEFLKKGLLQEYLNHVQDDGLDDIENVRAFAVSKGIPVRYLSLMLVTRSQDAPVGTPFNIPQYVMLLNIIANIVDMDVEEFTWVGGDTHIYLNQLELVKEQISRTIMTCRPTVSIKRKLEGIDDVKIEDIQISNYTSHPSINYPIAV